MDNLFSVKNIKFEDGFLLLNIDGIDYRFLLKEISNKLFNANEDDLMDFKVSPSGYGIHWIKLDEDISIPGLLDSYNEKHRKKKTYKSRRPKDFLVRDKKKK